MSRRSIPFILTGWIIILAHPSIPAINAAFGELTRPSHFTIQEAETIERIRILIREYQEAPPEERDGILDPLRKIYGDHARTIPGIVVLDQLVRINALDDFGVPSPPGPLYAFAVKLQDDTAAAMVEMEGPGGRWNMKLFEFGWLIKRGDYQALSPDLRERAGTAIFRRNFIEARSGQSLDDYLSALFDAITARERSAAYVQKYEAAMALLAEEHRVSGRAVSARILGLLQQNIPTEQPPPYSDAHLIYIILCKIMKASNDPAYIEVLETLSRSTIKFVSDRASEALFYVQADVPYPLEYERLFGNFLMAFEGGDGVIEDETTMAARRRIATIGNVLTWFAESKSYYPDTLEEVLQYAAQAAPTIDLDRLLIDPLSLDGSQFEYVSDGTSYVLRCGDAGDRILEAQLTRSPERTFTAAEVARAKEPPR